MVTEPSRIVGWIISQLERDAPFPSIERLLNEAEKYADEIERQSKGEITTAEILDWLSSEIDKLMDLLAVEEESWEELYDELLWEIRSEAMKLRKKYGEKAYFEEPEEELIEEVMGGEE